MAKLIADVPTQLTGSAAIKQQIDHQQQAQKAAEVFLETPQATVLNKQKFYIVKPKQGEDFTLPKKWTLYVLIFFLQSKIISWFKTKILF